MEFLQPHSWAEALAAKAAAPDALPIAGGTDVMVELNFARRRPPALLDLSRLPELTGWAVEGGRLRLGAGVTYAELTGRAAAARSGPARRRTGWPGPGGCPGWRWRPGRSGRRRSATGARSAATSDPRRRPGTAIRRCSRRARRSRSPRSAVPG